ncbi:hypothetical protein ADIARSV_1469 [Arcticibacter svalbardensis MN12-7]|uniref:Uncharacterized protein n=1 Tax=Arcticibacter svalbardensis MN12-7 TaxID=1150600 RepID=R9GU18_9SPHI|nr:hypothetical protein [Arcticibacter svalbardensis]EOR95357.1 hypothetical protein ADIARSV_1469 [Arcticibacter svalbardensis MN12-7]
MKYLETILILFAIWRSTSFVSITAYAGMVVLIQPDNYTPNFPFKPFKSQRRPIPNSHSLEFYYPKKFTLFQHELYPEINEKTS